MGLISFRGTLLLAILGIFSPLLYGQNLLAGELADIEKQLKDSALEAAVRREVLQKLARLLSLSGSIEGAAQVWMEAAFAEPGKRDDSSLLEGAACFVALGELDRAEAAVKMVLATARDRRVLLRARYLSVQIEAFRTGNTAPLEALLDNADYRDLKPLTYYVLWQISGSEAFKARLLSEFPASPEGRIARDAAAQDPVIGPSVRPMWLLFPGREEAVRPPAAQTAPAGPTSGERPAISAPPPEGFPRLQIGLFGREENARVMAERLGNAGFTAVIHRRTVNGGLYWSVGVVPGADINAVILRLRDAGFEAFPVYE
jgi:hypothetical protein